MEQSLGHELHDVEKALLQELRQLRRNARKSGLEEGIPSAPTLTTGQRIADAVASTMGSWRFIIIQTTVLFFWIILNVTAFIEHWDPYPFILLSLIWLRF